MKLLYFASLRETLELAAEELALPLDVSTLAQLRQHLALRGGAWQVFATSQSLRAAVNQDLADGAAKIKDADEIAFFPPVTGG